MADYTATLPSVDVIPLLWALPLLPAGGAALALWLTRPGGQADDRPVGRWSSAVGTWLALLAACSVAFRLGAGEGRALVAAGPGVLRLGSLDLHLGLTLDAPATLAVLVLLVAASVAQLGLRLTRAGSARPVTEIEVGLVTGLGALGLLASCPAAALVAVGVVARRAGTAWAGAALVGAGAALVSWGLTGAWGAESFAPGSQPHFTAVVREGRQSTSLTMVASPGAVVVVDGAPAASAPVARAAVGAGPHGISVDPGPGADTSEIRKFRIPEGAEATVLRLDGAQDTLGAATLLRARDADGPVVPRGRLGQGRRAGLAVSTWSGLLLGAGLLLLLVPAAGRGSAGGRALGALGGQTAGLLLAGLLGARLLPLWALGAVEGEGLGWALLAGGGLLALAGLWQSEPGRVVGFGAGASATLGLAAMAAGNPEAGLTQVVIVAAAQALVLWGVAMVEHRRPEAGWELGALQGLAPGVDAVRWLKLGYAALVALLPVGFGALEALRAVGPWRGLAALPLVALTAACLGRLVYRLSEGDEPAWKAPRNVRRGETLPDDELAPGERLPVPPAAVLAVLVVGLGPLAASTLYRSPVGGWLDGALVARGPEASATFATFATLLGLSVAALGGARWARGRHGAARPRDEEEAAPAATALRDALVRLQGALAAAGTAVAWLGAGAEELAGATSTPEPAGPPLASGLSASTSGEQP